MKEDSDQGGRLLGDLLDQIFAGSKVAGNALNTESKDRQRRKLHNSLQKATA